MKFFLGRDFCLWLVSSESGAVRKVRFTSKTGIVSIVLAVALIGTLVYVAGDYARVQILRAAGVLHLQESIQEREKLASLNQALQEELQNLKISHSKSLSYESIVRDKLKTLSSIIESATTLGLVKKQVAGEAKTTDEGVGGLEIDCSRQPSGECTSPDALRARMNLASYAALLPEDRDEGLDKQIDRAIRILTRLPLAVPISKGHVTSGYGFRYSPFGGGIKLHKGIDFSLDDSGKVHAAGDGVIEVVDTTPTYGLKVDLTHSKHVYTRYAHLSKVLVKAGDKVKRGQVIAIGGNTGRSTGPHLHYEVRVKGRTKDPMNFLVLAARLNQALGF